MKSMQIAIFLLTVMTAGCSNRSTLETWGYTQSDLLPPSWVMGFSSLRQEGRAKISDILYSRPGDKFYTGVEIQVWDDEGTLIKSKKNHSRGR